MTAYTEETFGFRDKIVLIRPSMEGHEDYMTVYHGELFDCKFWQLFKIFLKTLFQLKSLSAGFEQFRKQTVQWFLRKLYMNMKNRLE